MTIIEVKDQLLTVCFWKSAFLSLRECGLWSCLSFISNARRNFNSALCWTKLFFCEKENLAKPSHWNKNCNFVSRFLEYFFLCSVAVSCKAFYYGFWVLSFLMRNHSNESYWAVFSCFAVYIMSKVSEPVMRRVFKSQGNSTCHTPRFRKNSSLLRSKALCAKFQLLLRA